MDCAPLRNRKLDIEKRRGEEVTGLRDVEVGKDGRISWKDRITNGRVGEKTSVLKIIKDTKKNYLRHIMRQTLGNVTLGTWRGW